MSNKIIAQILGIDKGFKLKERKDLRKDGEIYFEVRYSKKVGIPECPYKCKGCKDKREYIVRNGKAKERIIKAGKVGTQRIYLIHRPQRYMCKKTGKSFRNEKISYRWQRITRAETENLVKSLRKMSISATAKEHGVSVRTVSNLLDSIEVKVDWTKFQDMEDIKLGIDEHSFRGFKMVTTIVELNTSNTIAILKSDKKEELKGFLNKIPYKIKQKITEAAIDMRASFKNAVKEELLGVKVVADHFHVVKDAQKKLRESIKIEEEVTNNNKKIPVKLFFLNGKKLLKEKKKVKKLYKTLKEHPYLKEYYRYLLMLKWMYKAETYEEGKRRLHILIGKMEESEDPQVWRWAKTYIRWEKEILQYFVNRTTTAKVEGRHTHIKLIKRISFGFKEVLRYTKKVLLGVMPERFIKLPNFITEGTTYCKQLSFLS